jgi:hypothetical protein
VTTRAAVLLLLATAGDLWALGDVAVGVDAGKLSIVGDVNPNRLQVLPGVGPGAFVVVGLEGTAVNGVASAMVEGVEKIAIDTGGGVDVVEILEVELDGSLVVKMGDDSDTLTVEGGRFRKKVELRGGKQDDEIRIRHGTRIGGKLLLKGGKHRDLLVLNGVSLGEDAEVKGGSGDDTLVLQYSSADDGANVVFAAGDGDDDVTLLASRFDDIQGYLGEGDDDLEIESCDFDGSVRAEGNDGFDELDLDGDNHFDLSEPRRVTGFEAVH